MNLKSNGRQETTAANSGLAKCGVQWLIEHLC